MNRSDTTGGRCGCGLAGASFRHGANIERSRHHRLPRFLRITPPLLPFPLHPIIPPSSLHMLGTRRRKR
eukprot:8069186-Pyramimonas_sp.AAC.2